ncbi:MULTISPECIES: hypothetical protein, partial [unclassified Microcoleus]|uniref:hypothetical protein n=1 Tax=unclassified Microcoleus TaxID=2642155 RepID=UPI0025CC6A02
SICPHGNVLKLYQNGISRLSHFDWYFICPRLPWYPNPGKILEVAFLGFLICTLQNEQYWRSQFCVAAVR